MVLVRYRVMHAAALYFESSCMKPTLIFRFVYSGFMSLFMVSLMSAWITVINLGWAELSFSRWFGALVKAWPVAWPGVFIFAPIIQKLVLRIVGKSRAFKSD